MNSKDKIFNLIDILQEISDEIVGSHLYVITRSGSQLEVKNPESMDLDMCRGFYIHMTYKRSIGATNLEFSRFTSRIMGFLQNLGFYWILYPGYKSKFILDKKSPMYSKIDNVCDFNFKGYCDFYKQLNSFLFVMGIDIIWD